MIDAARCAFHVAFARFIKTLVAGLAALCVAAVAVSAYAALLRIETRYLPVVAKFRIDTAEWIDPIRLNIYVRFTKRRPCRFVDQNWYVLLHASGEEFRARIPMRFLDRADGEPTWSRPTGDNRAGPWQVIIPTGHDEPMHMSVIHHDCGLPWQTVTETAPIDMRDVLAKRPSPG